MVTAETPNVRTTRAGITGAFGGPNWFRSDELPLASPVPTRFRSG